eukprot:8185807-Alexandrium_andersonii.AAC.1
MCIRDRLSGPLACSPVVLMHNLHGVTQPHADCVAPGCHAPSSTQSGRTLPCESGNESFWQLASG